MSAPLRVSPTVCCVCLEHDQPRQKPRFVYEAMYAACAEHSVEVQHRVIDRYGYDEFRPLSFTPARGGR